MVDVLAMAQCETDPMVALRLYAEVLDRMQKPAAASAFEGPHDLWGQPALRPYLQALFGAASSLWRLNQQQDALPYFRELLELDPADHQDGRYWLATILFESKLHDELQLLLDRYQDSTATWRYARALLAFRLHGDRDEAQRLLQEACELDADFLEFLLGGETVNAALPVRFGQSARETTHSLARLFLPAWRSTPGAAAWARRVLRVPLDRPGPEMRFPRDELRRLPRLAGTWQLGLQLQDPAAPAHPPIWLLGIGHVEEQRMVQVTIVEEDPTASVVWREVLSAFRRPMEGKPHRPDVLVVPRDEYRRAWQGPLAELGIRCEFDPEPQPLTTLLQALKEVTDQCTLPPLSSDVDVCEFPQTDEVWQVDFFHLPTVVTNEQVGVERPWATVVVDKQSTMVLSNELLKCGPSPEVLCENLLRTMARSAFGPAEPRRPRLVEVSDSDTYDFVKPKLADFGIDCVLRDELPELDAFCRSHAAHEGGPEKCALADAKHVTRDQMESFYATAARYFELAPWKHVPGEIPIEIQCSGKNQRVYYAIVLGRTGVTLGLSLFERWDDVMGLLRGQKDCYELLGLSVVFDEFTMLAPLDLYLVERHGWPIATPEAYPAVLRLRPGRLPQSPTAEDLEYLEACLKVIPDFVSQPQRTRSYDCEVNGKRLALRLAWQ